MPPGTRQLLMIKIPYDMLVFVTGSPSSSLFCQWLVACGLRYMWGSKKGCHGHNRNLYRAVNEIFMNGAFYDLLLLFHSFVWGEIRDYYDSYHITGSLWHSPTQIDVPPINVSSNWFNFNKMMIPPPPSSRSRWDSSITVRSNPVCTVCTTTCPGPIAELGSPCKYTNPSKFRVVGEQRMNGMRFQAVHCTLQVGTGFKDSSTCLLTAICVYFNQARAGNTLLWSPFPNRS